jgi:hypothetical protein
MDQKITNSLPLKTSGSGQIDLRGLNKEDRDRIMRVGLMQWMDELCNGKEKNARGDL